MDCYSQAELIIGALFILGSLICILNIILAIIRKKLWLNFYKGKFYIKSPMLLYYSNEPKTFAFFLIIYSVITLLALFAGIVLVLS
ncbi:hypothetical protein KY348_07770 [Candidatus Woesearchaeota archaeon]|nr:hypothetical protein [Candidatus Woesearchaeota archaeon]